ncbi:hypothetical protein GPECTOR_90g521 [Gonium pectorale]|uniref:Uncharacterized protein n=1 Tax=Gonium pectorale TaxID=33097 RepID=A0A150G1R6_GONPE|nr:hypothetical protein GPECTOR_90g521 [Gonium pectorale]|eukprot:KXZ43435.1 hypothetical protein GPECTOR_90g521 [Gonium pectorale]
MEVPPLMRTLRLVLSNGASITVPTTLRTDKPYFLNFDVYNRNLWRTRIKGEAAVDETEEAAPDRTKGFYARFQKGSKGAKGPAGKQATAKQR